MARSFVDALERDLIGGSGRWIADLNEFFRSYPVSDTTFDLYVRGRTRSRGLFLSRFFASTALPDYSVALFCVYETHHGGLTVDKLRKRMDAVLSRIREDNLHWAWLIVFTATDLPFQIASFVSRYDRKELGIAVGSTASEQVVLSNNQLGRSLGQRLGIAKLLKRVKQWKN